MVDTPEVPAEASATPAAAPAKRVRTPRTAPAAAPAPAAPTSPAAPSVNGPTEPIVVKHRDHQGKPTERTFSADVHGPDFAKVAEEFKATNADKLISDAPAA